MGKHAHACRHSTHARAHTHTHHQGLAASSSILVHGETTQMQKFEGLSWPSTKTAPFSLAGDAVQRVGLPEHTLPLAGARELSERGSVGWVWRKGMCPQRAGPPFWNLWETSCENSFPHQPGLQGFLSPTRTLCHARDEKRGVRKHCNKVTPSLDQRPLGQRQPLVPGREKNKFEKRSHLVKAAQYVTR